MLFVLISFLVAEGRAGQPKMMSVGLHCRLARPGRVAAIQEFLDYAKSYGNNVWICTREQIANHWYDNHLPRGVGTPIQADTIQQKSPASYASGAATSSSTATNGTSASTSGRFSFLGNLTVPRDQQPTPTAPTPSTTLNTQAMSQCRCTSFSHALWPLVGPTWWWNRRMSTRILGPVIVRTRYSCMITRTEPHRTR